MRPRGAFLPALLASGCELRRGALSPASPQARDLGTTFWIFLWVTWAVFVVVVVAATVACVRAARRSRDAAARDELSRDPVTERKLRRSVAASTIVSVVILFGLLVTSIASGRRLSEMDRDAPLPIEVTAHQWWWQISYRGAQPSDYFVTANELHVPVGRPIQLSLKSTDVIHSFWIPRLAGKRDLIPSHVTGVTFRVDEPGIYSGRCAEFCGLEHAKMDIVLVAETPADFERWQASQRRAAPQPTTEVAARGRVLVERGPCTMCHTVSGTAAAGTNGPDLTHFASRQTLGVGAAPMSRASIAAWMSDPQRLKPGTHMPAIGLSPSDEEAVVEYLETLK